MIGRTTAKTSAAGWVAAAMVLGGALAARSILPLATPVWWTLLIALIAVVGCCWLRAWRRRSPMLEWWWSVSAFFATGGAVLTTVGYRAVDGWATATALALLTFVLCRALLAPAPGPGVVTKVLALLAGGILVHQVGSEEMYDYPVLLMRGMAFGVLLLALALWLFEGWSGSPSGDRRRDASLLGPLLALVGFVAALVWSMALGPSKEWQWRLRWYFFDDTEVTELEDFESDNSSYFAGAGIEGGEGRRLPKRANIQLGDALRVVIRLDDPAEFAELTREPVYLRTLTLSVLDSEGGLNPLREGAWRFDGDDGSDDGRVNLAMRKVGGDRSDPTSRKVRHTIFLEASEFNALPMLAGLHEVELEQVYEYADDWYQLAVTEGQDLVAFRAVSDFAGALGQDEFGEQWQAHRDGPAAYRQMPSTRLNDRLRATAREITGTQAGQEDAASLAESMRAIRAHLAEQCRYSLSYENPDDLPAVENFLYGERLGHCELFAATTVMLLRSLDIPARVAYGYSGGVARQKDRVMAFRDRDFHAWAEVLVEGRGWVVFDTTPVGDGARVVAATASGSSGNRDGAKAKKRAGGDDWFPDLSAYQLLAGSADRDVVVRSWLPGWLRTALDFASFYLTEVTLTAMALLLLLWLALIARARFRARSFGAAADSAVNRFGGAVGGAGAGFLADFLRLWADRGVPKRPGETLREFAEKLRAEGRCDGEFDELVSYAYDISYSRGNRSRERERGLKAEVAAFAERSPGAAD